MAHLEVDRTCQTVCLSLHYHRPRVGNVDLAHFTPADRVSCVAFTPDLPRGDYFWPQDGVINPTKSVMNIGTRGTEQRNSFIPQSRVRCGGPSVGFVSARTGMLAGRCHSQTARPSKRRSCLHGLRVLQGDRPTSKMDASIPEPTPWPTSPPGKTALFNNTLRRQEIACRQDSFFGKSAVKFTIKLVIGRLPDQHTTSPSPVQPSPTCDPTSTSRCSPPQLTHTSPAYSNLKNI